MKRTLAALFLATLIGVTAHEARAVVIISNLDTDTFTAANLLQGTREGQSVVTGTSSYTLATILFPQTNQTDTASVQSSETFAVYLRNADGSLGTSVFNSFTLSFDSNFNNSGKGVTTATPTGAPFTLQPNTGYWFVITSKSAANIGWNQTAITAYSSNAGTTLPANSTALHTVGGTTTYSSLSAGPQVIQVNGTAVPEPSSLAMLGLALTGVGMVTLRRRSGGA